MVRTKLLLVDDEEDFVNALAERLRIRNYDTRVATSGEAALTASRAERPDVVLLDLKMPSMGGLEVLERMKGVDPTVEVIMLTGEGDVKAGESAVKAGAIDYLVKPFDIEILVYRLQEIEKNRGGA